MVLAVIVYYIPCSYVIVILIRPVNPFPDFFLQISKALAGTDRKDLMRKLPKFIYDEEKALEVSRCA